MPLELVTVPRVPVLRTGHYDLESGPVDFSAEHLAAAVDALENDPAVLPMRVRLELEDQGHLTGEGMDAEARGGLGGPAIGWADGYAVAGNTLYADLHVPAVVAGAMEWAFPGRSIEGLFGYCTATGHTHDFLPTGLLLLGTSWPGVTTLPDFHEVQAEFSAAVASGEVAAGTFAAAAGEPVRRSRPLALVAATGRPGRPSRQELAAASLNVSDLRMRWYTAESEDALDGLPDSYDYWSWYVTEVRADAEDGPLFVLVLDEATGQLWRFDVASIDGAAVTFAAPSEVMLEVVPVSARAGRPSRLALARWGSRGESRTATATADRQEDRPMTDEQRRALARALGLDPDTPEAEVHAEAERRAEAEPPEPDPTPEVPDPDADPNPDPEPDPVPEPAGVAARTTSISTGRLAELERDAAAGAAARAEQIAAARTEHVRAAVADGRITPAEAGLEPNADGSWPAGWRADYEQAPDVISAALDRLTRGRYPGATGRQAVATQDGGNALGDGYGRARASFGITRPTSQQGVK